MKPIIAIVFLAIVANLGQALYAMSSGAGDSALMARALTWRIALSIALFAFLMLGWYVGLIEPHSMQ